MREVPKSLRAARSVQCPLFHNNEILNEGESYCPAPDVIGICSSSGEIIYSHHCEPVTCENPVLGRVGTCDCPICPGMSTVNKQECISYAHTSHI